jgi:hypothetical protein
VLRAGYTETCHRLQQACGTETVHQWHWPGVNLAVRYGSEYGARCQLVEFDTTALHVEVKRLSMEVGNTTDSHNLSPELVDSTSLHRQ